MKILMFSILAMVFVNSNANPIQSKLSEIASEEAAIANIGANKAMMLYGTNNPMPVIERWNKIQNKPNLNKEQIEKINQLEQQKQAALQQVKQ